MNARRVAAVFVRIVEQFRRDPRSLALLFVAPLAIIALLGWVLTGTQATTARVAVVNDSGSPAGGAVALKLSQVLGGQPSIDLHTVSSMAEAEQQLKDQDLDVIIELPAGFRGPDGTIKIETLGLNVAAESSALPAIQSALVTAAVQNLGGVLPTIQRSTIYGSPTATQLDTLAPVIVGFFVYFFVFILTGISFLRERVGGTLERLLATPVSRSEIVLGYSLGFGFFATLQIALVMAFVFGHLEIPAIGPVGSWGLGLGVATAGSPLLAYFLVIVLGLGAVSLGIFLSTFARTELQILQFIPIVIVPQALLSGFFWPIDQLPNLLQPVARILPVTYAIDGLRQIMIAGAGLASGRVLLDFGVLIGIAALFMALAAGTIRREVA